MKLTLDGQELDPGSFEVETLSGLIQTVERSLAPKRVIVTMRLDGMPLDLKEEQARAAESLETLEYLDINTQGVDELASNTLSTLIDYLPSLIDMADKCVSSLQGEDEIQGHNILGELIDGLLMVSAAWKGIAHTIKIPDHKPDELIPDMTNFNSTLHNMMEAQESDDIVRLCDLLEFDLSPLMESWLEEAGEISKLKSG